MHPLHYYRTFSPIFPQVLNPKKKGKKKKYINSGTVSMPLFSVFYS